MMEKEPDHVVEPNGNPAYEVDNANKADARKGSRVNEATDMYGNVQEAEEYGYVTRG